MSREPADEFSIQDVMRHDEDQHAAVLQQRQRALIEQLFEPGTAFAVVAEVTVGILAQAAIGRVEPQQTERLARDQGIHQVAVDAPVNQAACMVGPFAFVLDGERLGLLAPEGVGDFGNGHAFAGTGIDDAHRPVTRRQCGECSFERGFVGRVVAALGEVSGESRKHEGHGCLLSGEDECRHARRHAWWGTLTPPPRADGGGDCWFCAHRGCRCGSGRPAPG
ncbi:hypothetical protein D9M70_533030 [compost metagenome]